MGKISAPFKWNGIEQELILARYLNLYGKNALLFQDQKTPFSPGVLNHHIHEAGQQICEIGLFRDGLQRSDYGREVELIGVKTNARGVRPAGRASSMGRLCIPAPGDGPEVEDIDLPDL